jgi:hypothetical protein
MIVVGKWRPNDSFKGKPLRGFRHPWGSWAAPLNSGVMPHWSASMDERLQWRKVGVASLIATAIISTALCVPLVTHAIHDRAEASASEPHPIIATDAEQRNIIATLLSERRHFFVRPLDSNGNLLPMPEVGALVLIDSSLVVCDSEERDQVQPKECPGPSLFPEIAAVDYESGIPRRLRLELIAASRTSGLVPNPELSKVIYGTRADAEVLFNKGPRWEVFGAKFPGAVGYIEYSRAVLSADGQHALIYQARYCHGLCFSAGDLDYLERSGRTWRVLRSETVWIS